MAEVLLM